MITLIEITQSNWEECVSLSVSPEQKNFVASNVYSLAESKYEPERYPLGISNGNNLVGFAMYGYDIEDKISWIIRFMIDKTYQSKGIGKEALGVLIKLLFEKYNYSNIRLCVEPENLKAIKFYENFGFLPTGEKWGIELVYELKSSSYTA